MKKARSLGPGVSLDRADAPFCLRPVDDESFYRRWCPVALLGVPCCASCVVPRGASSTNRAVNGSGYGCVEPARRRTGKHHVPFGECECSMWRRVRCTAVIERVSVNRLDHLLFMLEKVADGGAGRHGRAASTEEAANVVPIAGSGAARRRHGATAGAWRYADAGRSGAPDHARRRQLPCVSRHSRERPSAVSSLEFRESCPLHAFAAFWRTRKG